MQYLSILSLLRKHECSLKEIALPEAGISGIAVDQFATSILESLSLKENKDVKCDECEEGKAISRCMECLTLLCKGDTEHHERARNTKSHKVVALEDISGPLHRPCFCKEHRSEELKLFCESCDKPICRGKR